MPPRYVYNFERALELGLITVLDVPDEQEEPAGEGPESERGQAAAAARFEKFLEILPVTDEGGIGQREVLHYIQMDPGTTVPEIAANLGMSTHEVVGIINGGLQRNIAKAGFTRRGDILDIVKEGRKWHYYPGAVLKALGNREEPPEEEAPPTRRKKKAKRKAKAVRKQKK
jgi:hypothetical protein